MSSRSEELFQAAKLAISLGFVPIPTRGKAPCVRYWQKSRTDADDPEKHARRVQHLAEAKNPANNVGILCGEASNVVVVDLDGESAVKFWRQFLIKNSKKYPSNKYIPTFGVKTPSGGFHFYFKYDNSVSTLSNSNGIHGRKIDFRTNNGIVLFPGSISYKTGKGYTIRYCYKNGKPTISKMPHWMIDFIKSWQN